MNSPVSIEANMPTVYTTASDCIGHRMCREADVWDALGAVKGDALSYYAGQLSTLTKERDTLRASLQALVLDLLPPAMQSPSAMRGLGGNWAVVAAALWPDA